MFGGLDHFVEDEDYLQQHQTGILYLPGDVTYPIQFFAAVKTDTNDSAVYVPQEELSTDARDLLLSSIQETCVCSIEDYEEILYQDDISILALSTCSTATTNERIVLFGYIHEGGTEE